MTKITLIPINLLLGTLISQSALSFNFDYTGSTEFNDATHGATRRAALQDAADTLGAFFTDSATLNFSVSSSNDSMSNTLASAGSSGRSAFTNTRGYYADVTQHKILTGTDANGSTADGSINVNFGQNWDFDDNIASNAFDFKGVFMHELMHTLGFSSGIQQNGQDYWGFTDNENGQNSASTEIVGGIWTPFDNFLVDSAGNNVINDTNFAIDQARWNSASIGGKSHEGNGMFWNGANAVAANGGNLVGLYSPASWNQGSSVSHLDTENNALAGSMMLHAVGQGPAARTLTDIERGMLLDLGYTLVPVPEPSSTLLLGLGSFALIMRRRK